MNIKNIGGRSGLSVCQQFSWSAISVVLVGMVGRVRSAVGQGVILVGFLGIRVRADLEIEYRY